MTERVVVIGGGLIGAAVAFRLAQRGCAVTVVESGIAGMAASGRSFGWINASFHLDEAHFRLRAEGIAAWHRLQAEVAGLSVTWPGCLLWEETGAALEAQATGLSALGYPVEIWDRARIRAAMPAIAAPEAAMFLPSEGAAEGGALARELLAAAGVPVLAGCAVQAIETRGGSVSGVRVPGGMIAAERIVLAAGTATDRLAAPLGVDLSLLYRPAVTMRTAPVAPCLPSIAVAPGIEIRQLATGEIMAPTSPSHQADDADALEMTPEALAEQALARLRAVLPGMDLTWREAVFATRPMPADGYPVAGPAGPEGLYVAVMHSGVTLGALMGELIAGEVATGEPSDWLAPYRPGRFSGRPHGDIG